MATYTVWENERYEGHHRAERAIVVRDGFRFWALVFGPLWLLFQGHFLTFLATAVGYAAVAIAAEVVLGQAAPLVMLVTALWFAFEAPSIRRWALARRSWEIVAIVDAKTREKAARRYLEAREEEAEAANAPFAPYAPAPSPAPWGPRPQAMPLGLYPEGPR